MKKLLFIANHKAPKELVEEYEIIELGELAPLWANIPETGVKAHLQPLLNKINKNNCDLVVVVGEPRACLIAVNKASKEDLQSYSTYSIRNSIDEEQADGSVIKRAVFNFKGLVPYEVD